MNLKYHFKLNPEFLITPSVGSPFVWFQLVNDGNIESKIICYHI